MIAGPVVAALDAVTDALPDAEHREGQRLMAEQVADSIRTGRHLVVQAGTGTGKTLAYLVPAALSGRATVVVTATKALQDQLANKDLPFLRAHLAGGHLAGELTWTILKGRSNYVCVQRVREVVGDGQGALDLDDQGAHVADQIRRLAQWAGTSTTGDQAELDWVPADAAWRAVSVGSDECPGAARCPMGDACFAESARREAATVNVVVVNAHLYGLHVGSGGALLPEHDVVVFDEAHVLEDIMSDTVGVQIGAGRFAVVASAVRRILDDGDVAADLVDAGERLRDVLADHVGKRLPRPLDSPIARVLVAGRGTLDKVARALGDIDPPVEDARQKKLRAQVLSGRLTEHLDVAIQGSESSVSFVSGPPSNPRLEVAPLDVGPIMANGVWSQRTAVLTSATIPSSLPTRLGMPAADVDLSDVGSPFDYPANGLLYCALALPDPRAGGFRAKVHEELVALISAAGGRTLALFTSYSAMDEAADATRDRVGVPILTQRDRPKPALLREFAASEETCLFATAGFFHGVDVPGRTLSQVVIDRLPFPRPDDPLLSARRDELGRAAFGQIDVPRAATLLAQAAGRLIRSATDRGVVAVLDRRLGTANYRWDVIRALPPMRRTRDRAEVEAFLREITADH